MKPIVIIAGLVILSGCTAMTVQPIDKSLSLQHICIQKNPKVLVDDFVPVMQNSIEKYGISTELYEGALPEHCEYNLTYTALRSWDIIPYLSHAEIHIAKQSRNIASAEYHLKGKGGLSLTKWEGTKTKIEPLIDELLKEY